MPSRKVSFMLTYYLKPQSLNELPASLTYCLSLNRLHIAYCICTNWSCVGAQIELEGNIGSIHNFVGYLYQHDLPPGSKIMVNR